jgi:hypothetical protein
MLDFLSFGARSRDGDAEDEDGDAESLGDDLRLIVPSEGCGLGGSFVKRSSKSSDIFSGWETVIMGLGVIERLVFELLDSMEDERKRVALITVCAGSDPGGSAREGTRVLWTDSLGVDGVFKPGTREWGLDENRAANFAPSDVIPLGALVGEGGSSFGALTILCLEGNFS